MDRLTTAVVAAGLLGVSPCALAATVAPGSTKIEALPGTQVSVLWLIGDVSTPLFGYSLDLNLAPVLPMNTGVVTVDVGATNFFPARNLIAAGGATLDPVFSVILSDGMGGVFISANTDDGSTVLPVAGVNDVLTELVFTISADALGEFTFVLGPGSALSDAQGFPVPFDGGSVTITVVPAPSVAVASLLSVGVLALRRRRGA